MTQHSTHEPHARVTYGRVLGFAALPVAAALGPLLAIPVIVTSGGTTGWAAYAVGQSVGAGGAVLVELGWALTGPQVAASTERGRVRALLTRSLMSKSVVFCGVAPLVMLIAALASPSQPGVALASATAALCMSFSPSWLFIGRGSVRGVLVFEVVPRVLGIATGCALIGWADLPLIALPASMVFTGLLIGVAPLAVLGASTYGPLEWRSADVRDAILEQRTAVGARLLSAAYIALPVAIVGAMAPNAVAAFAAAERVMRLGLGALQSVPQAFQRHIAEARDAAVAARVKGIVRANLAVGVVAAASFAVLGPVAVDILLRGSVALERSAWLLGSGVVLATVANRALGSLALVRLARVDAILKGAALGAVVGLPLLMILPARFGASGAFAALVTAELAVLALQSAVVHREVLRLRAELA